MTSSNKSLTMTNVGVVSLIIIVTMLLLVTVPQDLDSVLRTNWFCDTLFFGISLLLLVRLVIKKRCDMLSAPIFLGVLYITMFFITPLYDIAIKETAIFGVTDLFDYGVKGSILAFLGFAALCFTYELEHGSLSKQTDVHLFRTLPNDLERFAIVFWIVLFLIGISCTVLSTGFSISYILSFGIYGDSDAFETSTTTLGFINQFTRGLVPLSVIIYAVGKNKPVVYTIIVLTAFLEIISGFRYMIVIMICAFFYYSFLSNNKKVRIYHLLVLALALSFIIGIVGFSRNSVRSGQGFVSKGFGGEAIAEAFWGNFRIYKSYYGIIKAVPSMTDYLFFDQMFTYTAIMVIPRAIWPDKPLNPGTKAQLLGLGEDALESGYAYPNLGEYYYSFGAIGVLFFMALFGYWLGRITKKFRNQAHSRIDQIQYCIAVPLTMQLLIRGYTPSNFYLIIALFFPMWLIKRRYSL